ncbi:MAG TPA: hypothetical protein VFF68_10055 [Anaerolineaceae bacterium]|nr:hypothetical protein [Anaerolineaceae bacterium]
MAEKIQINTTLSPETVEQIERIAQANRWNKNTVLEVAIEDLHARIFSQPNPVVTVEDAEKAAQHRGA